MTDASWLVANLFITVINLAVFGLSLKLYTEYFKERVKK